MGWEEFKLYLLKKKKEFIQSFHHLILRFEHINQQVSVVTKYTCPKYSLCVFLKKVFIAHGSYTARKLKQLWSKVWFVKDYVEILSNPEMVIS